MGELEKELRIKNRNRPWYKSEDAFLFELLVEEIEKNRKEIQQLKDTAKQALETGGDE